MPQLTNRSLEQLFEVLEWIRRRSNGGAIQQVTYQDAIRDVAARHGVTYQTIGDLCRRRLGLEDIDEFQILLSEWLKGSSNRLEKVILQHSHSAHHSRVAAFFRDKSTTPAISNVNDLEKRLGGQSRKHDGGNSSTTAMKELRVRVAEDLYQCIQLARIAGVGESEEETVIELLKKGFDSQRASIRKRIDLRVNAIS